MRAEEEKDRGPIILDFIGNTPIVRLEKIGGMELVLLAKCEFFNPSGSLKDRMAYYMIRAAEMRGELKPDSVIAEATSGNTGISLSMAGTRLGYRVMAVMPETMSVERRQMMEVYGAEIVLTPGDEWMSGSIARAEEMKRADPRIWIPHQFSNTDNVQCHLSTTGPELIRQVGEVDAFIAGVGTGGTLMGVGRTLKKTAPRTKIVAVEPAESPVLSGGKPGPHRIQGIGPGFIPEIVDMELIDSVVTVSSDEAIAMKDRLAREEGISAGISSGANVAAALKVGAEMEKGSRIAVILADSGDRYLSLNQEV